MCTGACNLTSEHNNTPFCTVLEISTCRSASTSPGMQSCGVCKCKRLVEPAGVHICTISIPMWVRQAGLAQRCTTTMAQCGTGWCTRMLGHSFMPWRHGSVRCADFAPHHGTYISEMYACLLLRIQRNMSSAALRLSFAVCFAAVPGLCESLAALPCLCLSFPGSR